MRALVIILFIIGLAAGGQLYLNNREAFRKNSKHLATRSKLPDDSDRRLI